MGGRPWSTVWGTLHEPRVVTAAQVTAYALLAATGALVLTAAHLDADVALGAVLMILGGAVGIPSAWRGWWGVEAPAAALTALGLVLVTVADLLRGPGGHWGGLARSPGLLRRGRPGPAGTTHLGPHMGPRA